MSKPLSQSEPARNEAGMAMILTVMMLLLLSAIAVSAIQTAGSEYARGGSARRTARTLFGAEAGLQVSMNQIAQATPNLSAFTYTLTDGTSYRSGTKAAGSAQPIQRVGTGSPPEGYSLNVGAGYVSDVYRANVTASSADGSSVELEAQLGRLESSAAY